MSDARYPKRSGPGDYDDLVDAPRDAASGQSSDPLAELARLIDEDPFADFHQRRREPPLTEEQAPQQAAARGVVSQPPEDVDPEPYDYAEEAADPQPEAYPDDTYAEPPRAADNPADYDALEAPMYREPRAYDPPAEDPPAYEASAYDPPAEDYAPQDAEPEEPSSYQPVDHEPRFEEPSSFAAPVRDPEIYREPEPDTYETGDTYETDAGEDAGSNRLYADLAAATQRVEPTFERPAPAPEAEVPPARYDPAADLDAGLAAGAPQDSVTEFDFGDLSGRDTSDSVIDPRALDEPVYADDIYERTDPVFDDSGHIPPYDGEAPDEPGGRGRGLFIVAGLVGLVVIGGAGALAYRGFGGEESSGPAPIIRADKSPSKVQPEQTDAAQAPQQGKLVYDRVSGDGGNEDARLVSREEPVADVGNRQIRVIDPNEGEGNGLRGTADAGDASLDSEDLPKRVRTVVVKPDGTIVGEIQPPRPAQPLQPAPVQPAPLPDGASAAAPAADTAPATAAPADGGSAVPLPTPRPADMAMSQPAQSAPTPAPAAPAPAPAQSNQAPNQTANQAAGDNFVPPSAPTSRASGGAPVTLQPAPAANSQPAPAPAPATQTASAPATTTFPAGSYVVQVAASRDAQDAQSTAASITQNYSGALGGYKPAVERADLGDRGIYYRVGVGPLQSQGAANSLCANLKSAGLDCFVRRN